MQTLLSTPKRIKERQLIASLKAAWSLRPGDEHVQLKDNRGRRLVYPDGITGNKVYVQHLLATRRPAKQVSVTPNVCLALPLSGFALVPTKVIRYQ